MGFFRYRKKRLRWRRILFPFVAALWTAVAICSVSNERLSEAAVPARTVSGQPDVPALREWGETLKADSSFYEVSKRNVYVCGEETIRLGKKSGADLYRLLEQNRQWTLSWNSDREAVLTEQIEDLSPECKQNAYFGIDEDGNLSLFDGVPDRKKVLRTFFQIDIERMESSLPRDAVRQLYEGIKVSDYASYNSVLSPFADFAVDAAEE